MKKQNVTKNRTPWNNFCWHFAYFHPDFIHTLFPFFKHTKEQTHVIILTGRKRGQKISSNKDNENSDILFDKYFYRYKFREASFNMLKWTISFFKNLIAIWMWGSVAKTILKLTEEDTVSRWREVIQSILDCTLPFGKIFGACAPIYIYLCICLSINIHINDCNMLLLCIIIFTHHIYTHIHVYLIIHMQV